MISVIINADTRIGWKNDSITVGEYGAGSLQGVRSIDLLTEGLKNKMNFFRGYDCQCIVVIDEHEPLPDSLFMEIAEIVHSYGNNSRVICKPHNRTEYKWNDKIYIEALKLAEGNYVVHFDNDSNSIRTDDCDIVERYFKWLGEGYKYICQPWDRIGDEMFHASTRFFICKRETLDFPLIESSLNLPEVNGLRNPCLEYLLGGLAGKGSVLYPPREDDKYLIWCWARYYKGTMKKLNDMPPEEALRYVLERGLHGAQDVMDKQ